MLKRLVIVALFGALLVSAKTSVKTNAKTYSFTVSEATQVGASELKPGDYKVRVDGQDVELLDSRGHRIDAIASVEEEQFKTDQTSLVTSKADGGNRLEAILPGGTRLRIIFQ